MLRLKKVAVTGGLASGKSSVCRILEQLGAYVVSADAIVHELLSSSDPVISQVKALFGMEKSPEIGVKEDLDRSEIAKIVFKDHKKLQALESILHPAVRKEIDKSYLIAEKIENCPLFVAEIPLLFEGGGPNDYDATIAVVTDQEIAIKRYVSQKGKTREDYIGRSANQLSPAEKAAKATYTLYNNGSVEALRQDTCRLFHEITSNP